MNLKTTFISETISPKPTFDSVHKGVKPTNTEGEHCPALIAAALGVLFLSHFCLIHRDDHFRCRFDAQRSLTAKSAALSKESTRTKMMFLSNHVPVNSQMPSRSQGREGSRLLRDRGSSRGLSISSPTNEISRTFDSSRANHPLPRMKRWRGQRRRQGCSGLGACSVDWKRKTPNNQTLGSQKSQTNSLDRS